MSSFAFYHDGQKLFFEIPETYYENGKFLIPLKTSELLTIVVIDQAVGDSTRRLTVINHGDRIEIRFLVGDIFSSVETRVSTDGSLSKTERRMEDGWTKEKFVTMFQEEADELLSILEL